MEEAEKNKPSAQTAAGREQKPAADSAPEPVAGSKPEAAAGSKPEDKKNPLDSRADSAPQDSSKQSAGASSAKQPTGEKKTARPKKKQPPKKKPAKKQDAGLRLGFASLESVKWENLREEYKGAAAAKYNIKSSFEALAPIQHSVFGWGFVLSNANDRLEILFKDKVRILISNVKQGGKAGFL